MRTTGEGRSALKNLFSLSVHVASAIDRQIVTEPLRARLATFIKAGRNARRRVRPRMEASLLDELPFIERFVAAMDDSALEFFTRHILSMTLQDPSPAEPGVCELEFGFCADSDLTPDPLALVTLQYCATDGSVAYVDHRCEIVDLTAGPTKLDEIEGNLVRLAWPDLPQI